MELLNVGVLIACLIILGLNLKLYTEYFKDRSQNRRKEGNKFNNVENDLDLPPAYRTEGNKYRLYWHETHRQLVIANNALRKQSRKIKMLKLRLQEK